MMLLIKIFTNMYHMAIKWTLTTKKISDLKEYFKNPRTLSKKQYEHLNASLEKFGLIDKPIITTDNTLIGGHQRLKVLKRQKIKEVECWQPDQELSPKDIEELNIRLNKNTGDWDFDMLANQWEPEDLLNWGFSADELSYEAPELTPENDNQLLEPPTDPQTKLGDIYQLGNHRLLCGDSTSEADVTKLLDGNKPILMVTDPPYGVEYDASWRGVAGKGQRAAGKVQNDSQVDWSLAYSLFPGSIAYVWHSFKMPVETLLDTGFDLVSNIIWVKQHFALSRGDYHWQHEPCWYAVKKGHPHNWQGSRKETTVWEIANLNAFGTNKDDERTAHSTQKPLECMLKPIRNNTTKDQSVYDPFTGSGTTLIAAETLKRSSYCMELDPAYCDIIVDRYIKYRKKQNLETKVIKNDKEIEWQADDQKNQ